MAESIFLRVRRLMTGTVEDIVDRMERAGGDAVMRESIREVDRVIDDVRAHLESAGASRLQAIRQQKMLRDRITQLQGKASFAVAEGRDDLAEAALAREIDFEAQAAELDARIAVFVEEETKLDTSLTALKSRKLQMDEALTAFTMTHGSAVGREKCVAPDRSPEHKVRRAEAAFDRALSGAGGIEAVRADAEVVTKVAEIDGLQRRAKIAERMAVLKRGASAA